MKIENCFKYFCFILASLSLFFIFMEIFSNNIDYISIIGFVGLFLVCIELGVIMNYEKLTAKVTFKNLFKFENTYLSPIGTFAHTLGQIGNFLIVSSIILNFFY